MLGVRAGDREGTQREHKQMLEDRGYIQQLALAYQTVLFKHTQFMSIIPPSNFKMYMCIFKNVKNT